jgi:CRP/FNR family transcriptional regulator, cyclic AMP receptor protein
MALLEIDPGLARRLPMKKGKRLRRLPAADVLQLPIGEWSPPHDQPERGHLGFLLANGLIVREICVVGAWSVELLDRGDLLRPWIEDAASFVEAHWRVIEPARLLVLEEHAAEAVDWRELIDELVNRALRRSRSMAVTAAISATRRVEDRLLLLLWHVAERRGRPGPNGVEVFFPVTHETLAHLVGARRPSVTSAVHRLEEQNALIRRGPGEWLLRDEAPSPGAQGR